MDDDIEEELDVVGEMDAHAAEALRLQIRRLARQHGIELKDVTIETEADEPPSA